MIPITHPKLLALKEYMEARIDGKGEILTISYEWIPKMTPDQVLNIYFQTGYWIPNHPEKHLCPVSVIMTFTEFCNSKMNQP